MKHSEQIGSIAKALAEAQGEMKPAPFDANNPFFKSKYASLNAIREAARPLAKHGLCVTQDVETGADGRIVVVTLLAHESGEWLEGRIELLPEKDRQTGSVTPQKTCAAVTYGRRIGLSSIVGVVGEEDDDGTEASRPGEPERKATRKPSAPAPKAEPPVPTMAACAAHAAATPTVQPATKPADVAGSGVCRASAPAEPLSLVSKLRAAAKEHGGIKSADDMHALLMRHGAACRHEVDGHLHLPSYTPEVLASALAELTAPATKPAV